MNSVFKKYLDSIIKMKENGVVIYGAGKMGKRAIEALKNFDISIIAVVDKQVGKKIDEFVSISLEDVCNKDCKAVCIVTPANKLLVQKEMDVLKDNYNLVIDGDIIDWMYYYFPNIKSENEVEFTGYRPFNHYESPYPTLDEIENNNRWILEDELLGINLNIKFQKLLKDSFLKIGKEFIDTYKECINEAYRFDISNIVFTVSDAALLHTIIRDYRPNRIIEIGSGYSTGVMLDTNEFWLDNKVKITCIEPYPDRLQKNLKSTDNIVFKEEFVQNIKLDEFDSLEKNDILFIDSSHVTKPGGDIQYEYFQILPRLKDGVLIHIHDIFRTFSYPDSWLKQGRAYTEGYVLRALLMNSRRYKIVYFNNYMGNEYKNDFLSVWGSEYLNQIISGGSMWLQVCDEDESSHE